MSKPLEVISTKEASIRYGIPLASLHVWSSHGKLPKPDAIVAGRTPVWRYSTLDAWAWGKGKTVIVDGPYNMEGEDA